MIRRQVIVRGGVQAVGFRDACRREAQGRGVTGWVRNRNDGAVEAAFEGEPEAVVAMCEWCRHGPRYAQVESTEIALQEVEGSTQFEIRW